MRSAFAALALAAMIAFPAFAADVKGTIVYEPKPGCEKAETDIVIRTSGSTAEILIGNKSRGFIEIDPATGNFLTKQTDNRLIIGGSITNGALMSGFKHVPAGCIGRYKAAAQ